jgi:hypothetical protein
MAINQSPAILFNTRSAEVTMAKSHYLMIAALLGVWLFTALAFAYKGGDEAHSSQQAGKPLITELCRSRYSGYSRRENIEVNVSV